jgi:arylsulfatase A-like enzyme
MIRSLLLLCLLTSFAHAADRKPNIIFIMADDMGYADLGCYGSKSVLTPHLDKMAAEGLRFTHAYAGSPVCGPTRCVLMTGLHAGHARRRDNTAKAGHSDFKGRPLVPLTDSDVTVAEVLKKAGYVTGGMGKWGLGNVGTAGVPEKQGFDDFYGYYDQVHAHSYYPTFLVRNSKNVPIPGNAGGNRNTYTHDLLAADALRFIKEHKDKPFFLYLPYCIPHGTYEVPDNSLYKNKSWPTQIKNYAAMISRMDKDIGKMLALLKELKIDEHTLVFFTSDHGANPAMAKIIDSNAPFRGVKRQVLEGGLRVPMIARWPGKVPAGKTSDFAWTFYDFLPTAADLAGAKSHQPQKLDGISIAPTLLGKTQKPHEFLYWEFYSPFQQAVRVGKWKGIRYGTEMPIQLYDVSSDPGESKNLAANHAQITQEMARIMATEHVNSKYWPTVKKASSRKGKNKKKK